MQAYLLLMMGEGGCLTVPLAKGGGWGGGMTRHAGLPVANDGGGGMSYCTCGESGGGGGGMTRHAGLPVAKERWRLCHDMYLWPSGVGGVYHALQAYTTCSVQFSSVQFSSR